MRRVGGGLAWITRLLLARGIYIHANFFYTWYIFGGAKKKRKRSGNRGYRREQTGRECLLNDFNNP